MTFDEWFSEREAFATRGERIMDMPCMDALRATWDAATAEAKKQPALIGLPVIDPDLLDTSKEAGKP